MYIYDIRLKENDLLVGDCGDEIFFNTEEEARADADDYIISCLETGYGKTYKDFEIVLYESSDKLGPFVSYKPMKEIKYERGDLND